MEIVGSCILCLCIWYAQNKPNTKIPEPKKKPDYTVEIYDHRRK